MTEDENISYCLSRPISQSHQRDVTGRLWERLSFLIREVHEGMMPCCSFPALRHYCESISYLELLQPSCIKEDGRTECENLTSESALGSDFILCETYQPRVFTWDWFTHSVNFTKCLSWIKISMKTVKWNIDSILKYFSSVTRYHI